MPAILALVLALVACASAQITNQIIIQNQYAVQEYRTRTVTPYVVGSSTLVGEGLPGVVPYVVGSGSTVVHRTYVDSYVERGYAPSDYPYYRYERYPSRSYRTYGYDPRYTSELYRMDYGYGYRYDRNRYGTYRSRETRTYRHRTRQHRR